MFNFFKKKKEEKEPHFDPTDIKITDIRKGFVLDYDLKTWEVKEEYEYDWGDEYFTYEYKLVSDSSDILFLSIENDDILECIVSKKVSFGKLGNEVEDAIKKNERPPKEVILEGKVYYREEESPGYFKNIHEDKESYEFISWDYYDETEKFTLTIEQWGDDEFEASTGIVVAPSLFSNILPGNN